MNTELFENTKVGAYFLWEYTQHENALALWHCAEYIGCFFESNLYLSPDQIMEIRKRGVYNYSYIQFLRNIAYGIFQYTGVQQSRQNWYTAERLIQNAEWCQAMTKVAELYHEGGSRFNFLDGIRSDAVREHYQSKWQ